MRTTLLVCLLSGLVFTHTAFAQDDAAKRSEAPQKFYRLDFVVKELENDKTINSRTHSTSLSVSNGAPASIRTGSRVPYVTGPPTSKQYQFFDMGVNIDCRDARETPSGQLTLTINVDISSLVIAKEAGGDLPPIVRTTRWSSPVLVPVKKATTVFSSDDPSGNRKMQLEVTVTPI